MCEANNFSLLNVRQTWQQLRYDNKGKVTRKYLSSVCIVPRLTVLISFLLTPPQTIPGQRRAANSRLGHKDLPMVNVRESQLYVKFSRVGVI